MVFIIVELKKYKSAPRIIKGRACIFMTIRPAELDVFMPQTQAQIVSKAIHLFFTSCPSNLLLYSRKDR